MGNSTKPVICGVFSPYPHLPGPFLPVANKKSKFLPVVQEIMVPLPRGTGPEIYPSNDGKNPSFGRVFPSKPGFFPSQTNLQSLWEPGRWGKHAKRVCGFSPYLGVWGKFHVLVVPLGAGGNPHRPRRSVPAQRDWTFVCDGKKPGFGMGKTRPNDGFFPSRDG